MAITEADRMRALMRIPEMELLLEPVFERSLRRVIAETMKSNGLGPITGLIAARAAKEPTPDGLKTLLSAWEREVEKNITPAMLAAYRKAAAFTLGRLPGDLPAVFGGNVRDVRAAAWLGSIKNRLVGIGQHAYDEATAALRQSLEAGEGTAKAADRVRHALGVSMRRATTIARTEAGAAVNGADASVSAELAAAGFEHRKEWLSAIDHRTRHSHADANGQIVLSDGKFTVGGVEMDYPHDPSAPAREVINCRCCFLMDVDDEPAIGAAGAGGAATGPSNTVLDNVPTINPDLVANMEKRGIDSVEWNRRQTNPNYTAGGPYGINCQRVVQTYEIRRRGFDVTAKPNPGDDNTGYASTFFKWLDGAEQRRDDGGRYLVTAQTKRLVAAQSTKAAEKMITDPLKYVTETVMGWEVGARGWVDFYREGVPGHIFNIERTAEGLRVIEAQIPNGGETRTLNQYMAEVRMTKRRNGRLYLGGHDVSVTRVDDLEFNNGVLEAIAWTK